MNISPDDRWMVCAPVRTGSRYVASLISNIYNANGIVFNMLTNDIGSELNYLSPSVVLHTHYVNNYMSLHDFPNMNSVVLVRNICDSLLSMFIATHTKKFHFSSKWEYDGIVVEKIHISVPDILRQYHNLKQFYTNIQLYLKPNTHVLYYDDIMAGVERVTEILGLDQHVTSDNIDKISYLPIKNPWNKQDWIENWEEVQDTLSKLDRRILHYA